MSYNEKNMEFWNSVCETKDKTAIKSVKKGNFHYSSIDAYYQFRDATKQWGIMGDKWGFKDEPIFRDERSVILKVFMRFPGGEVSHYGCAVIPRKSFEEYKHGHAENETDKKALTDGMTKCLSLVGFNADVFLGQHDNKHRDNGYKSGNKSPTTPPPAQSQTDDIGQPPICEKHNHRMKLVTLASGHRFWSCTAKDANGKNGYCDNSQDISDEKSPADEPEQSPKLKENLATVKKLRKELGWRPQDLLSVLPEWKGANVETEDGTRCLIAYLNTELEKNKSDVIAEAQDDELPFP